MGALIELRKDTTLKAYYGDLYRITYWVMQIGSSGNSYVRESDQVSTKVNLDAIIPSAT